MKLFRIVPFGRMPLATLLPTALSLTAVVLAAFLLAVLAPLLPVLRTSAQPVEGAAYTGTHSAGGGVEFHVSADGTNVENFKITNIPGDTCTQDEFNWPLDIPIIDDSFSDSLLGSTVTGSFPSLGEAEGTFKMYLPPDDPIPACESETLTWTATSGAPTPTPTPTPPPGCEPGLDVDGDGFDGYVECYVGTDPLDDCPDDYGDDAWPPDIDMNTEVNILDVARYKPVLSGPYDPRYDLNANGVVNILDVALYKPVLGASCTNP
jgi:hypothetical protein